MKRIRSKPRVAVHVSAVDLQDAQNYLSALRSLCAEGAESDSREVVFATLELLRRRPTNIDRLFRRIA
jgi:hypothetical protein